MDYYNPSNLKTAIVQQSFYDVWFFTFILQSQTNRILLVDDDPDHCLTYQMVLQDAGFECVSYIDSTKALQEFKPEYYDLVILDIRMPNLDGFAFCEKIREIDKPVKIVFITAGELYDGNFIKKHYPKLSNDVNITLVRKPIVNDELLKIVNMTIAHRIRSKMQDAGQPGMT
jgi:two-component system catabolic regulation response regulator CreB/two-component system response regulator ChvI